MNDHQGVLGLIGNTPLIEVKHIFSKSNVRLYLKLEGNNPGASVKDRPAFNMINEALKRGDIKKGGHLVEATSGNTGIALAFIARFIGFEYFIDNAREFNCRTRENYARLWCRSSAYRFGQRDRRVERCSF